jgi:glycosyltransferase involved in cell wall biosynthesis
MTPIIACIIPVYNEEDFIADVLGEIPDFVRHIIVVNDASTDHSRDRILGVSDPRVILIDHGSNIGVGGSVASGYKKAITLGADIIVKLDGDGQMDLQQMRRLVQPILLARADYTKGVRFRDTHVIHQMPLLRLIGNIGLSFLTKIASGYWNILDPTNGYTAISARALNMIDLDSLSKGYLLETDMLINLYRINAVVADVEMKAKYGAEVSQLNPLKSILPFAFFLLRAFCKRIFWRYFIFDFSAFSVFFLSGFSLFSFGFIFGAYHWIKSVSTGTAAPTGTIMLSAVPLLLGFQLLLHSAVLDINNVPKEPIQLEPDEQLIKQSRCKESCAPD